MIVGQHRSLPRRGGALYRVRSRPRPLRGAGLGAAGGEHPCRGVRRVCPGSPLPLQAGHADGSAGAGRRRERSGMEHQKGQGEPDHAEVMVEAAGLVHRAGQGPLPVGPLGLHRQAGPPQDADGRWQGRTPRPGVRRCAPRVAVARALAALSLVAHAPGPTAHELRVDSAHLGPCAPPRRIPWCMPMRLRPARQALDATFRLFS